MVIFWGSQSGTAEGLANRLARECHARFRMKCISADLSDYDAESITKLGQDKLAIFIVSTFGEGDPSDNTAELWQWLRSAKTSLPNLRYFAFGLGNSNYKYYNKVIDVITESLDGFGAQQLMPVGKADDATGATEEDFIAWKESLFSYFKQSLGLQECDVVYEPSLSVIEDDSLEPIDLHQGEPVVDAKVTAGTSAIKPLPIKEMRELFSTSAGRNCLHADLDISAFPEMSYKTGDHLSVWPSNPNGEVERLLTQLGRLNSAHIPISIKSLDGSKVTVPTPTTISVLLQHYLEICAPVSRDTISQLAGFAPTPAASAFLKDISKDRDTYLHFLEKTHVTLGRLLELSTASEQSATWAALPISFLIESLPIMRPRHYSISSSSAVSPRTPSITVLVSQTPLPGSDSSITIPGLASNYLYAHQANPDQAVSDLQPLYNLDGPNGALSGKKIHAQIRRSKFKLPALASQPIIMIAAGTGIAPFLGFIAERAALKKMGKPCGAMLLFFGCRHPEEDYLYRDELAKLQEVLAEELVIVTAFSRLESKKIYVQDKVREEKDRVSELLCGERNANVYVCGASAMARDVEGVICDIVEEKEGKTKEEVAAWWDIKKRTRKFQEDVWG